MKNGRLLMLLLSLQLLVSCKNDYTVEDHLYACIESHFSKSSLDLEKILDELEVIYINEGILDSKKSSEYHKYFQKCIDSGYILSPANDYLAFILDKAKIYELNLDSCARDEFGIEVYHSSKYWEIVQSIEERNEQTGQITSSSISKSYLQHLSREDFKHSFYRTSLLLMLHVLFIPTNGATSDIS